MLDLIARYIVVDANCDWYHINGVRGKYDGIEIKYLSNLLLALEIVVPLEITLLRKIVVWI